jgi:hypothetical protein
MVRFGAVKTEVMFEAVLTMEAFFFRGFWFPARTRNPGGREVHRFT